MANPLARLPSTHALNPRSHTCSIELPTTVGYDTDHALYVEITAASSSDTYLIGPRTAPTQHGHTIYPGVQRHHLPHLWGLLVRCMPIGTPTVRALSTMCSALVQGHTVANPPTTGFSGATSHGACVTRPRQNGCPTTERKRVTCFQHTHLHIPGILAIELSCAAQQNSMLITHQVSLLGTGANPSSRHPAGAQLHCFG